MPIYKVTYQFNQSVMSASENWYTANQSNEKLIGYLENLLAARFAMLQSNHDMVGVRVSLYGAKRASSVLLPPRAYWPAVAKFLNVPINGTGKVQGKYGGPDQFRAAMQTRIGFGDTRQAIRYLAGAPDNVTTTEPGGLSLGNNVPWEQAFFNFGNRLVDDGWCVRAQVPPPATLLNQVQAVTSVSPATSPIGIQIDAATAPVIPPGSTVLVQHFRPKKGTRLPTINGTWTVLSVNATLVPNSLVVYLRGSDLIDPATVRITPNSTIWPQTYQLYPVQSISPLRVGIHKRGRPSMAPRGRRLTRLSLDP